MHAAIIEIIFCYKLIYFSSSVLAVLLYPLVKPESVLEASDNSFILFILSIELIEIEQSSSEVLSDLQLCSLSRIIVASNFCLSSVWVSSNNFLFFALTVSLTAAGGGGCKSWMTVTMDNVEAPSSINV